MASVPYDSREKTSNFACDRRTFSLRILITLNYSNITTLGSSLTRQKPYSS